MQGLFVIMMQFLDTQYHRKINRLQEILKEDNIQNILTFEKEWWKQFCSDFEKQINDNKPKDILEKSVAIGQKITAAFKSIQEHLTVDEQIYFYCAEDSEQQQEDQCETEERKQSPRINIEKYDQKIEVQSHMNEKQWSEQLNRMKESLEECEKQNTQLMKRLVKSLERCSALIQKVDRLKQQNVTLQTQDNNSMKYYQRLLAENKKELKQKDQMIRLYEIKLQVYRGQQSLGNKYTERESSRGYPYTSEGILDRIQSLRVLAKGKLKSKSNATQIQEIS